MGTYKTKKLAQEQAKLFLKNRYRKTSCKYRVVPAIRHGEKVYFVYYYGTF